MITGIIRSGVKHLRYTHRWHQPCYPVHVSSQRMYSDHVDVIAKAKLKLDQLTEDPGNEAKLKLYSLYKQVRFQLYMHESYVSYLYVFIGYNWAM